jgi:hypothetical protein
VSDDQTIATLALTDGALLRRHVSSTVSIVSIAAFSSDKILVETADGRLSLLELTSGAWHPLPIRDHENQEEVEPNRRGFSTLLGIPPSALLCCRKGGGVSHTLYDIGSGTVIARMPRSRCAGHNPNLEELYLFGQDHSGANVLAVWNPATASKTCELRYAERTAALRYDAATDLFAAGSDIYELVRQGAKPRIFTVVEVEDLGFCSVERRIYRRDLSAIQHAAFQFEGTVGYSLGEDSLWQHDLVSGTSRPHPLPPDAFGADPHDSPLPRTFRDLQLTPDGGTILVHFGERLHALQPDTGSVKPVGTAFVKTAGTAPAKTGGPRLPDDIPANLWRTHIAAHGRLVALCSVGGGGVQVCDMQSGQVEFTMPDYMFSGCYGQGGAVFRSYAQDPLTDPFARKHLLRTWDMRTRSELEPAASDISTLPDCVVEVRGTTAFLEARRAGAFDTGIYWVEGDKARRLVPWDRTDKLPGVLKVNSLGNLAVGIVEGQRMLVWELPSGRELGRIEGCFGKSVEFVIDPGTVACATGNEIRILRLKDSGSRPLAATADCLGA